MKKRTTGVSIALMILTMSLGMVGSAAAASPGQGYAGNAYGSFANVGNTVQSGRTSPVGITCVPPVGPGFSKTATTAGVNVAGLLKTGVVDTSLTTGPATGLPVSKATSSVTDVSLLGGLISASAVKSDAATWLSATGYRFNTTGSGLVGMTIAGLPMVGNPAPNTTIALPGVGKVVLNEQVSKVTSTSANMTVNMVHVYVTIALPGIPAGTQIILGHSQSGLTQSVNNSPTLVGGAYSAVANINKLVTAGQEFPISMCGSTGGKTKTNSAASTNIPGVVTTGTAANTVNGTLGADTSTSKSTATVQKMNLLGGLVTVGAIKAEANASITGTTVSLDELGSTFVNLNVNGNAIPADVPANTKIVIGGITVWLNRVIQTKNGITVRAIEITVSKANPQGLPIGADIQVASATASAYPFPS